MGAHSLRTGSTSRTDGRGGRVTRPGRDRAVVWLTVALVVAGSSAVLGAVLLWPRGDTPDIGIPPLAYVDATIVAVDEDFCDAVEQPGQVIDCTLYTAELTSGDDTGTDVTVRVPVTLTEVPELELGDEVVLRHAPNSPAEWRYSFEDYQRSTPMLWLSIVFVVAVVVFGRWLGARALLGLGLSLFILVAFIVPALLHGGSALAVALAGATLVAFVAIYLAHGFGVASSIALAGTLASLAFTALLAVVVAAATQLSGLASEEAQVLNVTTEALDLRGLLIAGIVIGALGVLDDVTVSQVATVAALRRANAALTARQLYAEAIQVGRDHVSAAVNTLVLAYAGAALPLLLFFSQGGLPVERILTGELVAVEIVRMLVGSIGLILSVPVTTGLAALILARTDPPEAHQGHTHAPGIPPAATLPPPEEPQPSSGAPTRRKPPDDPVEPWF